MSVGIRIWNLGDPVEGLRFKVHDLTFRVRDL